MRGFFRSLVWRGIRKNPIPPDQSSWSLYGKLRDDNQAQLRDILDSAAATGERSAYAQKIGYTTHPAWTRKVPMSWAQLRSKTD